MIPHNSDRYSPLTCLRVPVLSILDVARIDSGQARPHPALAEEYNRVRRHLFEDNCSVCQGWYHRATGVIEPVRQAPRWRAVCADYRLAGGEISPGTLTFLLPRPLTGVNLDRLGGLIQFRRRDKGLWLCRLLFPLRWHEGAQGNPRSRLKRFDSSLIRLSLKIKGQPHPRRIISRLDFDQGVGLITPSEPLADLDPCSVERVSVRRVRQSPKLDMAGFSTRGCTHEAVTGVPGIGCPVPDASLSAEELCRVLIHPPHWFVQLVARREFDGDERAGRMSPEVAKLVECLGLNGRVSVRRREFLPGEIDRLNTSEVAFSIPQSFNGESYLFGQAMVITAAFTDRPLPPWVVMSGTLEKPWSRELSLGVVGRLDEKIQLTMGQEPGYNVTPLVHRLYAHPSTERYLGPLEQRTLSGNVRLLLVPMQADPAPGLLPPLLASERVTLRLGDFGQENFDEIRHKIVQLVGDDLLVVQVPTVWHALYFLGYHRVSNAPFGPWPVGPASVVLPAFRVRYSDRAKYSRSERLDARANEIWSLLEPELAAMTDVHERLTRILRRCCELLRCHSGNIGIEEPHQQGRWLRVWARWGEGMELLPPYVTGEEGINREVLDRGKRQVCGDYSATGLGSTRMAEHYPAQIYQNYLAILNRIQGCADFPVKQGTKTIGVICFHRGRRGPFDEDDLDVVERLVRRAEGEILAYRAALELFHQCSLPLTGPGSDPTLERLPARHAGSCDLEAVCNELAEAALSACGAFRTMVRTYTPSGQFLRVTGLAQSKPGAWPEGFCPGRLYTLDEARAGKRAIEDGTMFLIADIPIEAPDHGRVPPSTQAHAAITLRVGARVLGVLSVDFDRPQSRSSLEMSARSLSLLAGRYAALIRSVIQARLRRQLDALYESIDQNEPDMQRFLTLVARMVGTDRGSVFLRRPGTARYCLSASLCHEDWAVEDHWYAPGEGATGWVIEHATPLRIADLGDEDERAAIRPHGPGESKYMEFWDRSRHGLSFLGAPILAGNEVLGVLRLIRKYDRRMGGPAAGFDDHDVHLIHAEALRLGARLHQQQQERHGYLLQQLPASLYLHSDLNRPITRLDFARKMFQVIGDGIGPSMAMLLRLVDRREALAGPVDALDRILAVGYPPGPWPAFVGRGEGISGHVWQSGTARIVLDTTAGVAATQLRREAINTHWLDSTGCLACVPLLAHGANEPFVGTLSVLQQRPRSLSADEVAFIRKVTTQAAHAFLALERTSGRLLQDALSWAVSECYQRAWNEQDTTEPTAGLLIDTGRALLTALGGSACWIWRAGEETLTPVRLIGEPAALPLKIVNESLGGKGFVAVVEPESDQRLMHLIGALPADWQGKAGSRQRVAFPLVCQGRMLGLFFLVVDEPARLSYRLAEQAERILTTTVGPALHTIGVPREKPRSFLACLPSGMVTATGTCTIPPEHLAAPEAMPLLGDMI